MPEPEPEQEPEYLIYPVPGTGYLDFLKYEYLVKTQSLNF
jgi:hypothetical protein